MTKNYRRAAEAAFPTQDADAYYHGMSLRDYFAAQALTGMCTMHGWIEDPQLAQTAYVIADAMLEERNK